MSKTTYKRKAKKRQKPILTTRRKHANELKSAHRIMNELEHKIFIAPFVLLIFMSIVAYGFWHTPYRFMSYITVAVLSPYPFVHLVLLRIRFKASGFIAASGK